MRLFLSRIITSVILIATPLAAAQAQGIDTKATYAVVMDYDTGAVLYDKQAEVAMAPSSMSKLMTAYLVFERLKAGKLKLDDTFVVSENAWRKQGSKMFVQLGNAIRVEDLIRGVVIQSGNDACIVLAEGLAGTEEAFAQLMTKKAQELGMAQSHFKNATGWPDPEHVMSVKDLAILARHIIKDFPEYYKYYSELEYHYNGIRQFNRNLLLRRNIGVDGLKTGHTEGAGYGITISGVQNGHRLIVVVNGLQSDHERADEAQKLFSYGILNFEKKALFKANDTIESADVWMGTEASVPLITESDVSSIIPKDAEKSLKVEVHYNAPIAAPVKKGDHIADLKVTVEGMPDQTIALVAGKDVEEASFMSRLFRKMKYRFTGSY